MLVTAYIPQFLRCDVRDQNFSSGCGTKQLCCFYLDLVLYVLRFSPHYQDYRWWWRTFLVSGGSAFYVLIYAVFYFVNKVKSPEAGPHISDIPNKLLSDSTAVKWTCCCPLIIHVVIYVVIRVI